MKKFPIADLAAIIKAQSINRVSSIERQASSITGVSIDSRTTKPGDCFFAIKGKNFDGHNFVADAFSKGAVCAVVSKDLPADNLLKVEDTIEALGLFAAEYREQCGFKVVAITGSVGKTTTRRIAAHILSQHFRVCEAPKNFNNDIGLPLTLLSAGPETEIVIAELGSSRPGEIAPLSRIAAPDIAVVTKITAAHLEGFGSLDVIGKEKLSIADGLRTGGVLITDAYKSFEIKNLTTDGFGSRFTIDAVEITLPLPGAGNIENALTALAICRQFNISLEDFAYALKTLPAVTMRTEIIKTGSVTILNDCYNANPASMRNALDILAGFNSSENNRLVFICGDMAELGPDSRKLHAEFAKAIVDANVQLLLAVGSLAALTALFARRKAGYTLQTECFENTVSACNNLHKFIKDNDIVLVKGSRPAKLELAVEKLKQLFA